MRLINYVGSQNKFTGGVKKVVAELASSNVPENFPQTGEGIVGLGKQYELLPFSSIYIINESRVFMMNEEREWVEQG